MNTHGCLKTGALMLAAATGCHGAVVYTDQERTITVSTAADGAVQAASATDFAPFVDELALRAPFATPDGGTGVNTAEAGIDCHLDPNRIRLIGRILGAGGTGVFADGTIGTFGGHAAMALRVHVALGGDELVSVASRPRPDVNPDDAFTVKIRRTGGDGTVVLLIDETSSPTALDTLLTLPAGNYSIEYETEITVVNGEASSDAGFILLTRSPDVNADGAVNTADLVRILGQFGKSGVGTWDDASDADLNGDRAVDTKDLVRLLGAFGQTR